MKKVIVSIACCVLVMPLALAKDKKNKAVTEQGITVSATTIVPTPESGEAASYQPQHTLVVQAQGSNGTAVRYVLDGPGHVVNQKGEIVRTAINPGTRVRVYFASTAGVRTIDHVVVD